MNSESHLRTWNVYQAAWGPVSNAERRDLLARSVSDRIIYTDPGSQVEGVDALAERIAQRQARFAGFTFRNASFLEHLFHWTMYDTDGAAFVKGVSFGRFEAGRLVQATGFFAAPRGDG